MSEKKFNIDNSILKEGTVVIREGKAQEIFNPRTISITGTLRAPFEFLKNKMAGEPVTEMGNNVPLTLGKLHTIYDPKRSHLLVDTQENRITLVLNEKDNFQDAITGMLKEDPSWREFGINEEQFFNLNEVIKLIKRNKFKFADAAKHGEFLVNLNSFNARVTTEMKHHREQGGSSLDMVQKTVAENKNAPEFKLNVPIYQGYPKKVFSVQTCLDATQSNIRFYFESVDLYELLDSERESAIAEQLALFADQFPCSVITIS